MKKLKALLLVTSGLLVLNSCEPDPIEGCTDVLANNYNADADTDDGSCTYTTHTSDLTFWYDDTSAAIVYYNDPTSLDFFVNGALIHSETSNFFGTADTMPGGVLGPNNETEPTCGTDPEAINLLYAYTGASSQTLNYQVKDNGGTVQYSGTLSVNANSCTKVFLDNQ